MRAPPEKQNPAPCWAHGNRAEASGDDLDLQNMKDDQDDQAQSQPAAARARLETFGTLLSWYESLLARVERTQLIVELVDHEHYDPALEREIADFNRIVCQLSWPASSARRGA